MIYGLMRALMRTLVAVYLVGLFTVVGVENVPRSGPAADLPKPFGHPRSAAGAGLRSAQRHVEHGEV